MILLWSIWKNQWNKSGLKIIVMDRWQKMLSQVEQEVIFLQTSPQDRLEKEAERTIAVVVERAHNEAIVWVCVSASPLTI